jgi:thymidylate synthase (FAD)
MKVTIVGHTTFLASTVEAMLREEGHEYESHGSGAQDLIEFAGRACYQSWKRPNPKTATNEGYLQHIIEVNHGSVLRHGSVSIHISDVSRSLTHELVRHHHLDPSQLSQRFVMLKSAKDRKFGEGYVTPPLLREDGIAATILEEAWINAVQSYEDLVERALELLPEEPADNDYGPVGTDRLKAAREAARAVLPNMTPTSLVLTGNHQAWRQAIVNRASLHADAEICELFVEILKQLSTFEPNLYQDMHIMNNGYRAWVCDCNPGGSKSVVWHDKAEAISSADPENWK